MGLSFNFNFQSGLEFHCEVVIPDNDALKPALYQGLVEGFQVCGLLLDEILQFIYAGNLCVPNQITVRTLDLNLPFSDIAKQLNAIAETHFDLPERSKGRQTKKR